MVLAQPGPQPLQRRRKEVGGEQQTVDVIDDWKVLKNHIVNHPNALVLYKVEDVGETARVRVMAGSLGIDKTLKGSDEELDQMIRFMEEINAVVVKKQLPDEYFFM